MMIQQSLKRAGNYGTIDNLRAAPGRGRSGASSVVSKRNPYMNIATWNVRTMMKVGKLENVKLEMKKMNINILGLCETRYKDAGEFHSGDYHIIHSGSEHGQGGVALILDKATSAALLETKVINHRIMVVKLSSLNLNTIVVQVYMPTTTHSDEEVEENYELLEEVLKTTKARDNVIVMGDWNSIVGEGKEEGIVGRFGLGWRNGRGQRLVDFCRQEGYVVTNTWNQVPYRRRYTWTSPGDSRRCQIDYILVKQRYRNQMKKSIAYPGADVGSDHNLLMMTYHLRWKKLLKKRTIPKWNIESLKLTEVKNKFQEEIEKGIGKLQQVQNLTIEQKWQNIKYAITKAAKDTLGEMKVEPRKPWITPNIIERIEERRKWKKEKTERGKSMYKKLKNEVDRECKLAREKWWQEQCNEVEQLEERGCSDLVHRKINCLSYKRKGIQDRTIADKEGNPLLNPEEKMERWREYVAELYDEKSYLMPKNVIIKEQRLTDEGLPVLREEFDRALHAISNAKAPGMDNIQIELIKAAGNPLHNQLYSLINCIYQSGVWPSDYTSSIIIPFPKQSNANKCEQFRTISLVSHASKILLQVIKSRINNKIESALKENQFGFRRDMGTREAIGTLRMLGERMIQLKRQLFVCFIDYEKAFDYVPWRRLFALLGNLGVEDKILTLVRNLYEHQEARVSLNVGKTESITIKKGVRQGCLLSPGFFNAFSEQMMAEALEGTKLGVSVNGEIINAIKFADDQAIIAGSPRSLQILVNKINNSAKKYGMIINTKKTKIMVISKHPRPFKININSHSIEQVQWFRYLGQVITEDARCDREIRTRIALAKAAFREKQRILASKKVNRELRKRILQVYVWSVALYGSETWTVNLIDRKRLEAFEMWCYRRMEKISWTEKKTNETVLEQMGENRRLKKTWQKRRLSWLGHALRHPGLVTKVIEGKILGKKGRGRPRNTLIKQICSELDVHDYVDLKKAAMDRHQ